ncbi:CsgG/HfaB family protein [uncultured Desulfobacter sp.]|uniref:CsgG/HfaB family protein n=1 Tax=uncultured Desulfobacter sp. TaxID=240139 RepID=UPI002AAB73B6|nr:CsgG/HfaB family protein [uncultured Desulfobacter sp.]
MKKNIFWVVLICFMSMGCVMFGGCAMFGKSKTVVVSPKIHSIKQNTYAILPFSDIRTKQAQRADINFMVTDVMLDAFETALLKTGAKIVERPKIKKVLDEMQFSYTGNVDEDQLKEIGKLTNSDAIVIGMIRAFANAEFKDKEKPDKPTKCTTISFSVKAIEIETGEILWKGSITKSTGLKNDFMFSCDCDVLRYADPIASTLVADLEKASEKK